MAASSSKVIVVRLPENRATEGHVELSPFDRANKGRAIPMMWFYEATLDPSALLVALREVLASYPVLCGRYNASPPTAVELNNAGVPIQISTAPRAGMTLREAIAHLPIAITTTTNASGTDYAAPCIFSRDTNEPFLPSKLGMDPDPGNRDVPLLSVKITLFQSGGTAIGVLAQHGVVDADALIAFMRNWSRVFRGQVMSPEPSHDRCIVNRLNVGRGSSSAGPGILKFKAVPQGVAPVPEFAAVMPQINGTQVCVVPLPAAALKALKAAASAKMPTGQFVSTDDMVAARTWQSLCAVRCAQLGIDPGSAEVITCSRACNFRKRTQPPLGSSYCGNGVSQVWTELTVGQLLAMPVEEAALHLRQSLETFRHDAVADHAQWLCERQLEGCRTVQQFDAQALTFIISSWNFDWEGVDFNVPPVCFDHAANVPIVAVLVPRAKGDGLNVYASGTQAAMEQFSALMTCHQ